MRTMHECERDYMVRAHSERVIGQHQKAPHKKIKKVVYEQCKEQIIINKIPKEMDA